VSAAVTSLPNYILRRSLMYTPLAEQVVRVLVRERQLKAEAEHRAARLVTVRRQQRVVVR